MTDPMRTIRCVAVAAFLIVFPTPMAAQQASATSGISADFPYESRYLDVLAMGIASNNSSAAITTSARPGLNQARRSELSNICAINTLTPEPITTPAAR